MEHLWYKCPQPCTKQHCVYCDGGLAYCIICKKGEADLEPECPGPQQLETQDAI
jgi:hypothetical protein